MQKIIKLSSFEALGELLIPAVTTPAKNCLNCSKEHIKYSGFCSSKCKRAYYSDSMDEFIIAKQNDLDM